MSFIADLYRKTVLAHPLLILALVLLFVGGASWHIRKFELDANADSLFLEQDEDLRRFRQTQFQYGTDDYLLLLYKPKTTGLFGDKTLTRLDELDDRLQQIDGVVNVISILDIPLLKNPPVPIEELQNNIKTLRSENVDIDLAKKELRDHPLYTNLIVSEDLKTCALKIDFAEDQKLLDLLKERMELRDRKYENELDASEKAKLHAIDDKVDDRQDRLAKQRHKDISRVREVMSDYKSDAKLFLGGASMVTDDMMTFIRRDLKVFGLGMLLFIVMVLFAIFRRLRWILLPLGCCVLSVAAMMGLLGLFEWEVTVISSNFISLQLIMTIALTIHLMVRYSELQRENPEATNKELVGDMMKTIFIPCLYTVLTTIAGFSSLVFSGIKPVIHFGWMMTMGLCVSLLLTFTFFPACMALLKKPAPPRSPGGRFSFTSLMARITERHAKIIYTVSAVIGAVILAGVFQLRVENSFIDYFHEDTEIYQGMHFVDRNFGGTTPLDVILKFDAPSTPDNEAASKANSKDENGEAENSGGNEMDEFGGFGEFSEFEEFDSGGKDASYWFTANKMEQIRKIHNYLEKKKAVGKVLSIETMLHVARDLMNTESLDTFDMTLLFKKLPQEFKDIIITPYVSEEDNEARITVRIKDSTPDLQRAALLSEIRKDLNNDLGFEPERFHLTGAMVLYNNMLQSLFRSQIQTIGVTVLALMIMFLLLFQSLRVSLIAIFPNLMASFIVLGIMGVASIPLDLMTITIVAISIGIAVDNTIHYIHRFKHEFAERDDYLATMHACHGSIGNALSYISITIIFGFSILAISNFVPTVLFGLFTALAMIVAVIAALTLLPRLIILLKPFGPEHAKEIEKRDTGQT